MANVRHDKVTDSHPDNPWGASDVWHHHGAVAVGNCSAYVEANPAASVDALWVKAKEVAAQVFDVHLDSGDPVRDAGLLAAIDAVHATEALRLDAATPGTPSVQAALAGRFNAAGQVDV